MNRRILIADDDRIQRRLLEEVFSKVDPEIYPDRQGESPFQIEMFDDGQPLVSYFQKEFASGRQIPLCILDVMMPRLGGLDAAMAIRETDPDVFITIITSNEAIGSEGFLKDLKRDVYFIRKPIRADEMWVHATSLLISWNSRKTLKQVYRENDHARRQLEMFIGKTPVAVAMLDRELRYLAYSQRWLSDFDLKEQNLLGRRHYDVIRDIPDQWKTEHRKCLAGETVRSREEQFIRADGSVDYVKRELHPWRTQEGDLGGIIVFIEFITERVLAEQARKAAEDRVRENEAYLKTIMDTIQTGVMIIDPENYKILDVNPWASRLLKYDEGDLIGHDFYDFRKRIQTGDASSDYIVDSEYVLQTAEDQTIHVRRSVSKAQIAGKAYLVQSLLDITDIREMMRKQEINIDTTKQLLNIINGDPPRYTVFSDERRLFIDAVSIPCFKEGGDHFFVRNFKAGLNHKGKTVVSLKDQSGHEVGCLLRCITTDLIHHMLLNYHAELSLPYVVSKLNDAICYSYIFKKHDFFTSVFAHIDHQSLDMEYVSAGHPRFLLIRGKEVLGLPESGKPGKNLFIPTFPGAEFSSGVLRLRDGDRLLFYTDGLTDMPKIRNESSIRHQSLKDIVTAIISENAGATASDIMHGLFGAISEWSVVDSASRYQNRSSDDITILCLEIESGASCHMEKGAFQHSDAVEGFIRNLYQKIEPELRNRGFPISGYGIRSLLEESIMNAWKHGNRRMPHKSVTVRWRFGNDFHLEIEDEGDGFNPDHLQETKDPPNLMRPNGRGIYIIGKYADDVIWRNGGSHLELALRKYPGGFQRANANLMERIDNIRE